MDNEQVLLDALKQYEDGLYVAIQQTLSSGKMDPLSAGVAQEVSSNVPGASQLAAAAGQVIKTIANIAGAGPYSAVSRVGTDISQLNLGKLYKDVFSGRTFNTDNYWGAAYYYRYVAGQSVNNQNQVSDAQVLTGLKWFEDKLGVFVSGREHLLALQQGAQQYIKYYGVNSYTTTDPARVANAVRVMQTYMPNPDLNGTPGSWANAIGVYDAALAGMVAGSPAWQAALNGLKQNYEATDQIPSTEPGAGFDLSLSNPYVKYGAFVILVILAIVILL